ncbi:MAG: LpxI family protein [Nitrospira sp.]
MTGTAHERPASPNSSERIGQCIGVIAGNGRFPIIFADNVRRQGYAVSAVAHIGETDPELERHVDRIHWVKIGQLNKLIHAFKHDGVRQAVMLGGVRKTHVFTTVRPDFRILAMAGRLRALKDDAILRELAAELEREGIIIRESTFGLDGILVEERPLTQRRPSRKEWDEIRYGWEMAREIGRLDIGQCVVVKERVIVAVEAVEGTDQAIRRGGELAGAGAVVVKRCKPQQDLRFDLPAVGPRTIETMVAVKASALAVEAGKSVMLDRADLIRRADDAGIAVVGLTEGWTA